MVESQELIKGSEEKSFREGGAAAGGRERRDDRVFRGKLYTGVVVCLYSGETKSHRVDCAGNCEKWKTLIVEYGVGGKTACARYIVFIFV